MSLSNPSNHSLTLPRAVFVDLEQAVWMMFALARARSSFSPSSLSRVKRTPPTNSLPDTTPQAMRSLTLFWTAQRNWRTSALAFTSSWCAMLVAEVPCSGLGCLRLVRWSVDHGSNSKLSFTVWACPQIATVVVKLYNTVLCVHSLLVHTDLTVVMDNGALYYIGHRNSDIELYELLAQFISSLRGLLRDDGALDVHDNEVHTRSYLTCRHELNRSLAQFISSFEGSLRTRNNVLTNLTRRRREEPLQTCKHRQADGQSKDHQRYFSQANV